MATSLITPAPGWMVDPNNPNGVIPIGTAASVSNNNTPTYGAVNTQPTASAGTITKTSSAPAPTPVPASQATLGAPNQTVAAGANTPGYSYVNGVLTSVGGQPTSPANTPPALTINGVTQNNGAPTNTGATTTDNSANVAATNGSVTTNNANTSTGSTTGNANTTNAGLLQSQANTAATNPLSDPSSPLVANLKSAQDAYAALKSKIAAQFGAMETSDEALPVVLGQEGALQKKYAAQLDALAQNVNTAQTALGQAVSAYSAQTSAQNAATTQSQPGNQYIQQGPANTLVGANGQPVVQGSTGSTVSALTGQPFTSTGNANADAAVSNALQMIKNGAGYTNAINAAGLSTYGPKALTALSSGLPAGFNPTTSDATATASATNIGTAGTAATSSWSNIYATANTNQANYATAQSSINALGSNILATMANSPGINASDSRFLNAKLNDLSTQFNSPAYANFNAQIAGLQRMVSQYLSAGEIPTSATQGAQSLVDGSLTVGALASTLQGIDSDLNAAATAAKGTADYAQQQMQQGNTNTSGNTGSTSTGAFSDASFYGGTGSTTPTPTTAPKTTSSVAAPPASTAGGILAAKYKIDTNGNLVLK